MMLLLEFKAHSSTLIQTLNLILLIKKIADVRVSLSNQKEDMVRQEQKLESYCQSHYWSYQLISDLGSDLNSNKKGLNELIELICTRQFTRPVLTHQDLLLRFGSPLFLRYGSILALRLFSMNNNTKRVLSKSLWVISLQS